MPCPSFPLMRTPTYMCKHTHDSCLRIPKWQLVNCHILQDLNKVIKYSLINREIITVKRSNTTQNGVAQWGISTQRGANIGQGLSLKCLGARKGTHAHINPWIALWHLVEYYIERDSNQVHMYSLKNRVIIAMKEVHYYPRWCICTRRGLRTRENHRVKVGNRSPWIAWTREGVQYCNRNMMLYKQGLVLEGTKATG